MDGSFLAVENSQDLMRQVIYLMGTSFILGSLITVWLLLLVDRMHHTRAKNKPDSTPLQ